MSLLYSNDERKVSTIRPLLVNYRTAFVPIRVVTPTPRNHKPPRHHHRRRPYIHTLINPTSTLVLHPPRRIIPHRHLDLCHIPRPPRRATPIPVDRLQYPVTRHPPHIIFFPRTKLTDGSTGGRAPPRTGVTPTDTPVGSARRYHPPMSPSCPSASGLLWCDSCQLDL